MPDSTFAVFSDVHANLEALRAVLADMDTQGISRRYCLGDTVGYAANPSECLELVRGLGCPILRGNHDEAAATEMALEEMRDVARWGIVFARKELSPEQRGYLLDLPLTVADHACQFVHASLKSPGEWPYVMRGSEAQEHFNRQTERLGLCGDTHVPTLWHWSNTGNIKSWRSQARIELPAGGKTLINVGSVGQPRDLCPDACYVICDARAGWVEFEGSLTILRRRAARS